MRSHQSYQSFCVEQCGGYVSVDHGEMTSVVAMVWWQCQFSGRIMMYKDWTQTPVDHLRAKQQRNRLFPPTAQGP